MYQLSVNSITPYFVIMALCFFVANHLSWLIDEKYYTENSTQRHHSINGIRAILAMSVFFHHSVITYYFYQHGRWEVPPSAFFTLLGQVSVGIFFSITGFLFWGKALHSNGVISYKSLLISRIRRIAPAYLLASSIILMLIAWQSKMLLNAPLGELLRRSASLLFSLGTLSRHPINGIDPNPLGAGVFWTLQYEWRFYLALPLLAILLRNQFTILVAVATLTAWLTYKVTYNYDHMPISMLFLSGILTAHSHHNSATRNILLSSRILPFAGIAALVAIFLFFESMYGYAPTLLMFVFFVSLVHMQPRNPLYTFLKSRPARLLGAVSYSTYILHSIVIYLCFTLVNHFYPVRLITPYQFWGLIACIAVILVLISSLSYKYVEHPFFRSR